CNDVYEEKTDEGYSYRGDPMEIALINAADKEKISHEDLLDRFKMKQDYTFDNTRKMMSQIYKSNGKFYVFAKGASEVILNNSEKISSNGTVKNLDDEQKANILTQVKTFANEGLRVIALATKEVEDDSIPQEDAEKNLTFLGLAGFIDPPRKEAKQAISECKAARIDVKMITGDYEITAKAIADEVGIDSSNIVLGSQIENMSDDDLQVTVKNSSLFARTTPEHKLRIVKALKNNGERVAVTGDGINDAPALRSADIGVAMGLTGTDVAKNVADMVLLDDNFATITLAVETARKLYDNLRKGVRYYLAVKLALIVIFLLPVLFNIPLPFAPIQIILLELFMDLAASATFVVEPSESDVMAKPPNNPEEKFMDLNLQMGIYFGGLSLIVAVLSVYFLAYFQGLSQALTMAFATWMVCHVFLAYNMRTEKDPLYKVGFFSNLMTHLWAILVIITLLVIIYVPPLQAIFSTTQLTITDWVTIVVISAIATFWIELVKILRTNI
ncbi:MAG: HAD-IC family P-type ATPase, partial [Candidatus Lokiarchaeota archaeon]|nr:HAD-IC family P-type ATPase [Candidatus Lokiarchaeota archaeon]MBD3343278.1 HAD-IC family P-type ATPase [Candidatus Lokiarchaeota archaeon]